ncbi:3-dehydroquinate dehydratase [Methanosarcina thermophila]|jgi:3-dehydroquinate dehydratase-1|uniref:3-dehydroquinate dehydratase n=3 Tax=Methanosarcina thermophila TaxID=2210 RepID=A0A1I6X1G2_METTE|nr:type I 3-dehydroquinate dehydratase [Methanosarcina thermophila]ALK04831.1 MAG: 3-dehydroquinate dehydratase [Methanosarcina sp. 795]AKB13540.1 3-dehydroquinate dehydratase I [Methanosarcina thermophila TM-1]AKB15822.1 3-dehydroquinate dehydratase I [Methanosarcina thermophila CHTI-55]NLU57491.1 type I 3-dehydroquinate dehydratase [Methanosarcina thermophila]SFT32012.1 3-dehydroquinate dehydratase [Methanosarcina thermophila]
MIRIGSLDLEEKAAVVAVILENPLETSRKAAEMGADILEIRLDLLGIRDLEIASETIRKIKSETRLPLILTNRSSMEGGKWQGKEAERTELLKNLLSLRDGPDAVDIELSAGRKARDRVIKAAKTCGKTVIVSFHNFSETPPFQEMKTIFEESFLAGADIAKLAVMPHSMKDVLDLLRASLDAKEAGGAVCAIAMGRLGKHTRVIAPFYGSVLTYAAVEGSVSAAPGQFQVDEVKKIMELLE